MFSAFSVPGVIVSDDGKCFMSKKIKQFCFGLDTKHVTTTSYYPKPSHAERCNLNLRSALIVFHGDSQTSWDENLSWLQLAFSTATRESTCATPFQVMFPVLLAVPVAYGALLVGSSSVAMRLQPGDKTAVGFIIPLKFMIFCRNHPLHDAVFKVCVKLFNRWRGPLRIDAFLTPVTVKSVEPTSGNFVNSGPSFAVETNTLVKGGFGSYLFSFF
jgi:hypothetical protein